MRYLIFVSLFVGFIAACSSSKKMASDKAVSIPFWMPELMDSAQKNDFRMTFSTPQTDITGIYIVKQINGKWRGTIINEFGLKVLDFVSSTEECKLLNVISFLDKWYIKKEMASDIRFMMEIDNENYKIGVAADRQMVGDTLVVRYKKDKELQRLPDGTIKYTNHKRGLTYYLRKISERNNN
jgi:myo-inositol-hexaphosphate 3-phosphohydrolase